MSPFAYSIGHTIADNMPGQSLAASWSEFVSVFDAPDYLRSTAKGGRYICGPMRAGQPAGKSAFATWRCNELAAPVAWLALDFDSLDDLDTLIATCGAMFTCLWHHTASSTPQQPRIRVVAPLDRLASPAEVAALAVALGPILGAQRDTNQDRTSQPLYLPLKGAQVMRCDDAPSICVDMWLPAVPVVAPPPPVLAEWTTAPCAEWRGPTSDDELIRRAMRAQSTASAFDGRASFADLWNANAEPLGRSYPDPLRPYDASSADAALAQRLAWWTGRDCERIKRLMERSALARDKWESHSSYLFRTILGAVGRQEEVLTDKAPAPLPPALTVPSGTPDELTPDDFYAYLPTHSYINRRTREFLSVDAVNGHLRRFGDSLGMKPAAWLDMTRAVHQMSWQPSRAEIIEGMIADNGYLRPDPTGRIYNLYRSSDAVASDADAAPWVEHVRRLYLEDAEHLIEWFAYRIQNPGEKINHALVIGGAQGIGKDLLLEPLRYGVGESNFADINPGDLFKDFTGWVESTLLIVNEARDLGDVDRYKFYEHAKRFIAAPPDTLPCNRKYLAAYNVPNVMGVVITSNNKLSGLYIDPDDRRHYVAWSNAEKQSSAYFDALWAWMEGGGKSAVLGYLQRLNLADFNPKAPPPKTEAWHQIVAAHVNPEETALSEAVEDAHGNRIKIATVREIIAAAQFRGDVGLAATLQDKRNARKIPQMLERIGFEVLRNPYAKSDGRWRLSDGRKDTLYVDRLLPYAEQIALANSRTKDLH